MILPYPQREAFFAYKFLRLMSKVALAMEIGADGCWLLSIVAMQEDACRYRRPVLFFNQQLCTLCGFVDDRKLVRVRDQLMGSGWLVYAPGTVRKPGSYHVQIPVHASELEDESMDEGDIRNEPTTDSMTHKIVPHAGVHAVGHMVGHAVGHLVGHLVGHAGGHMGVPSYPLSFPNSKEEDSARAPAHDQQIEDIMQADQATAARVAGEPMVYSWQDWRREHPRIGIARTGEDGDADAWRDLWKNYGRECFDAMYAPTIKRLADGKKLWFSQAAEWLSKNTQDV